ncbi:MAG: hypothetical protein ACI8VT_002242 [Saprospiraceae bacterium]|jgi:hypothetical protein
MKEKGLWGQETLVSPIFLPLKPVGRDANFYDFLCRLALSALIKS